MIKKISTIITAAGYGRRMGGDKKKQFLMLGDIPLIARTLQIFQNNSLINEIVLVVPDEEITYCEREVVAFYGFTKIKKIISGGEKRQDSVYIGLQSVSKDMEIVVVHDGVRPFLTSSILESSIKEALDKGAAVAALPVKDTLKKVSTRRTINEGISRDALWRIQTPQAFRKEILIRAFDKARKDNFYGTDESTLVARLGIPVYVVDGSELNIKITTKEDIVLGESILISIELQKQKDIDKKDAGS